MKKSLFYISLKQFFLQCFYNTITICKYSQYKKFITAWLRLKINYLFCSPYTISRFFLQKNNEKDIYVYGETPITTMAQIARLANINTKDHVYELGAGTGFTCLWLHEVIGCNVTAIEQIPNFCNKLRNVASKFSRLEILCDNFLNINYARASVVYLYGSNLECDKIQKLANLLANTKKGTTIITVSYELQSFINTTTFNTIKQVKAKYEWGVADVYIQQKI